MMIRRYYLVIFLIGLILAVAPSNIYANNAKQASASAEAPTYSTDILDEQTRIDQAKEYQAPCARDEINYQSDLCAQWQAAAAARDAADWAFWSLGVALVGSIGIVIALGLTMQSNRIARDTARRQLRAYVLPTEIQHSGFEVGKIGKVQLSLSNAGQTPAYNVMSYVQVDLYPSDVDESFLVPKFPDELSESPIGPGHGFGGQNEMPRVLDARLWDAYVAGKAHFVAFGMTSYRDIFGIQQNTQFRFRARYLDGTVIRFVVAPKGNSAS
ncbi:hypothetical protein [Novosphingobium sp.]|uniref:hypothetical protein n=1 Tax=Novosphingobium sp. TaxID=1874826 RepID=UPI00286E5797|nr:hypothetical protein [Novosphingobium sp.]